ncbi:MAG: serine/threonine protein kinase [Planctomycetes bacterium]|nr:serine/threonine protein kinase [Planctomycetota bacterium]
MKNDPFAITPEDLKGLRFEILESETLAPGDTLVGGRLGKFRIVKRLGIGGWGVAYFARHVITERPFTIKVLAESLASSTVFVRRFVKEAKITAQLDHQNVRQVFDVDQEQDRYYMVMEYVDGVGLQSLIQGNRFLPPRLAARIAGQVSRGLLYAHERGILHRDVKPRNILVGRNGLVKLTDFGLAKVLEEEEDVTQAAGVLETPEFQSPEHLAGWDSDVKADIYGLGATFFCMLTGEVPFRAPDKYTLAQILETQETPSPQERNSAVPGPLAQIVMNMMNHYPFLRHQNWAEAIDELSRWLERSADKPVALPTPRTDGQPS